MSRFSCCRLFLFFIFEFLPCPGTPSPGQVLHWALPSKGAVPTSSSNVHFLILTVIGKMWIFKLQVIFPLSCPGSGLWGWRLWEDLPGPASHPSLAWAGPHRGSSRKKVFSANSRILKLFFSNVFPPLSPWIPNTRGLLQLVSSSLVSQMCPCGDNVRPDGHQALAQPWGVRDRGFHKKMKGLDALLVPTSTCFSSGRVHGLLPGLCSDVGLIPDPTLVSWTASGPQTQLSLSLCSV